MRKLQWILQQRINVAKPRAKNLPNSKDTGTKSRACHASTSSAKHVVARIKILFLAGGGGILGRDLIFYCKNIIGVPFSIGGI